jgi:transitional endoplasmic reticulum ATPase
MAANITPIDRGDIGIWRFLVLFPGIALFLLFFYHTIVGTETTFQWGWEANGRFKSTTEVKLLLVPFFYVLMLHVFRAVTAFRRAGPRKVLTCACYRGALTGRTLALHAGIYMFWVADVRHNSDVNHWTVPLFLLFLVAAFVVEKTGWLYGLKVSKHELDRIRQDSQQDEESGQGKARQTVPSIKFKDIFGNEAVKKRLLAAARQVIGTKQDDKSRNGILLHGEPGNGKTVFAEALAGELNLPFLQLTYGDVQSAWVGQRTVNIRNTFEQARQSQPCLLFIDEIDSFLPDRTTMTSSIKEDGDVVNTLLTLLVDIRKCKVLVVAATNFVERLDAAATREGRFDFKVEIEQPDSEARIGLLRLGLKKNCGTLVVADEVVNNLANRWNGFSAKRILAVTEELPSYIQELAESGHKPAALQYEHFGAALRRIQGRKGVALENVMSLDDLVLPTPTRDALNMIAGRLHDPLRVERLGGSLPSGVLFFGPAGTGKTTAAKALAKAVGSALLISTGADLARNVKELEKLYAQAKELRPTIIFIDEADDLLRSREYSSNSEATNKLLTLMDGANDRVRDIVWIAATNHPDQIDPALLRGGRFTEKVEFALPTEAQTLNHIVQWIRSRNVKINHQVRIERLADQMGQQSVANVEAVLQYAVNRAIANTKGETIEIMQSDLDSAMTVVLGM